MLTTAKIALTAWRHRNTFRSIRAFVLFVGYPRSGHTLIGQCLNAHPDAVIGHETNVIRLTGRASRDRVFATIIARDRWFQRRKAQWTGYDYRIGHWQHRWRELCVIGDKAGGVTSRSIAADPDVLDRFARLVEVPLRLVHHVRHPLDTIATMYRKGQPDLEPTLMAAVRRYFDEHARGVAVALERAGADVLTVYHEDAVADPRAMLVRLAQHVGLTPDAEWVDICAAKYLPSPRRSRDSVTWTPGVLDAVREGIERYPWFGRYAHAFSEM